VSGYARISLPAEIADELVAAKLAVRPITTRGPSLAEVWSMTVDCINTGAAIVSIVTGAATLRRFAAAIIKRRHPSDPDIVTINIAANGTSKSLSVDRTKEASQDEVLNFLVAALDAR
jgi:hypothetical protein